MGPDRVSRRASHFLLEKRVTQQNKQTKQNVTDVLLGLPADRDGPCPTTVVLHRISHSFHRGCRIAGRIERLEQWWVDLDVSEHEADWAVLLVFEHQQPIVGFLGRANDIVVNGIFPGVKQVSFFLLQLVCRGTDQAR